MKDAYCIGSKCTTIRFLVSSKQDSTSGCIYLSDDGLSNTAAQLSVVRYDKLKDADRFDEITTVVMILTDEPV
ncbi:hypothetical protein A7U60_g1092 [Sanghuangporus baumii]|uniref:Uncharacterized protein n=1 Tax=Sanghuangporus baumii TaxID=108892 RepID=A0A9Q5I4J0_SANBA|nr:hypothetical protein A7U60_g1092 [Sanghuangporus baumii]